MTNVVMKPRVWVAWCEGKDDDCAYVSCDMAKVRAEAEAWYGDKPNQTIYLGVITLRETLRPREDSFPWQMAGEENT